MSNLVDFFLPVFKMGTEFSLNPGNFTSYDDFRAKCIERLDQDVSASELHYSAEECKFAHFAVVVWLDELVLRTSPVWITTWRSSLLQSQRFATAIGGEEFYTRLDEIDLQNKELRQIYLFCLLLGFQGKYAHKEPAELRERIEEERKCLPDEWQYWPCEAKIITMGTVKRTPYTRQRMSFL